MMNLPDEVYSEQSTSCQCCGKDLNESEACLEYINQEIEPPVIQSIIKEYRYYSKTCSCGHRNEVDMPTKGSNRVVFGKRIQAFVVYLNIVQCVPYKRLQEMMLSIFGIQMSQSTRMKIKQF